MKVNINTILLAGIILFLIWKEACNEKGAGEIIQPKLQIEGSKTTEKPTPITERKPDLQTIIRNYYQQINIDSLLAILKSLPDSIRNIKQDSLRSIISDDCLTERDYADSASYPVDTLGRKGNITTYWRATALGRLKNITQGYKLNLDETKIQTKNHIYAGLGVVFESKFSFAGVSAEGLYGSKNLYGIQFQNLNKNNYYGFKYVLRLSK